MKQFFYNSICNKEILIVLEEIETFNNTLSEIDALIKNKMIYQASVSLEKLNIRFEKLDEKIAKTVHLKYIFETERQRKNELFLIIQNFLKLFLFGFEKPLIYQISISTEEKTAIFALDRVNINILKEGNNKPYIDKSLNSILIKEFDVNLNDYLHLESKLNEFKIAFASSKIIKSKSKNKKIELIDQLLETFKLTSYISNFF